jgi:hypothetical protein
VADKELIRCRAWPTGSGCPEEWCRRAQYAKMCSGCLHFTSGRTVSIYQQEKKNSTKEQQHGKQK